jgi:signal transduction histidine kinase/AraC-like DNA-binding protein
MLQQGVLDGDETAAWQCAISELRRDLLSALDDRRRLRAEDLFGQARVVIGEAIQRSQNTRQLQTEHQTEILRDLGQELITTFDVDKLADVLAERLVNLDIKSCYLACFEKPMETMALARLVLAYSDGRRADLGQSGRRYPSRQLVPADLLPARRYSLLVEPLFFRTEPLGYVVFEVGLHDGAIYEVLRGHISSALKGAMLFHEAYEARAAAERADQVKTRLLANVSHELRTPLNIIIDHTQRILEAPPVDLVKDLEHIQNSAGHQLRIINDLLDLSRAEINALDLYPVLLEPKSLMEDAFAALAQDAAGSGEVEWRLELPDHLPAIEADPVRLRQILLNLLSNAAKFTEHGQIVLGAGLAAPYLHIWVSDTGIGIPPELAERIFEPFFTHERSLQQPGGIGLGLTITRHLVALHKGFLDLDSQPGKGTTFHLYMPLPIPSQPSISFIRSVKPTLWLISNFEMPPPEIVTFAESQHLEILWVGPQADLEAMLTGGLPHIVAWDLTEPVSGNWLIIRRLQNHPQLSDIPFILLHPMPGSEAAAGLTSLVVKSASSRALWKAIRPATPSDTTGSVLIIDDDPRARGAAYEAVKNGLPGYVIRSAEDGEAGLAALLADPPSMVILDLMMPGMDGFEVLDRMRADQRTRQVPVVILSARQLSLSDVKRLEKHASVLLQSKGILSEEEIIAALHRSLFGGDALPPQTSALVKQAIACIHQNYSRPLARWEIAESIGVSEDYLSRLFKRELGISPWDYLNRYRVSQAKESLHLSLDNIGEIALKVGFSDSAYFSRVFRQMTGMSPSAYRDSPNS